jgi:hypothetical protein
MNDDVARANAVREEGGGSGGGGGGAQQTPPPPPPPQQQQQQPGPVTYMVTVPAGIFPGMQFMVNVEGQNMSEYI